ncbi:MAG: ATP-binding cassette domain-containing protein, partial [Candidatus Diapherotrites archaeon]|nr:ATP-binding cassette domain-containing protein [Candidatus Diapherotrites archaeon]
MNAVSISNLSKKYGNFLALDRVNLEVEEGRFFALVGPNGAGKTTLLRVLTTQLEPNGGEAYVLGKNIATQESEVKKVVGYVPQEMSVWTDITGYENLLIYSKIYGLESKSRESRIEAALDLMDLKEVAGKMVNTYSGGMMRKLEIASAIMLDPKILFLDEPTIGLDPAARNAVWERLKKINLE